MGGVVTACDAFAVSLDFVWQRGFDSPRDGYHVTPGDSGGGTKGGVIEKTWRGCVAKGLVAGALATATDAQLATVLRHECWGAACDGLPAPIAFLLFNGRMMSGHYPKIFQACLGLTGDDDVDGDIGPETLALVPGAHVPTLMRALVGSHFAYCRSLAAWPEFHGGWTTRLNAAREFAATLVNPAPAGLPV
nr:glycosyl hydrolase 108 family protein [uncultured Rhodopila sp.]